MKNLFMRRPFMRPLLIWIIGILLHLFFSYFFLVIIGLLSSFSLLFLLTNRFIFSKRGVWGMVFCGLLLSLSVIVTEYRERETVKIKEPGKIERLASNYQHSLVKRYDVLKLSESEKAILATLTLGYRREIPKEVRRQFSLVGVSHILAVSGFHVAIVCLLIYGGLSFFSLVSGGRWVVFLLTILFLWSFVWIAGLSASAVRAGTMLTLYQVGHLLKRPGDKYNTLAAAAFLMLVYNPFYLFDIGFQLSYIAVWFILYLQPRLKKLIPLRNPLLEIPWNWLTVTIAAQVGTTFLCLYYFGEVSTLFLFTNLPIIAIVTLLIPAGILWLLLPVRILGYVIELLTHSLLWIVERFSIIPFATFRIQFDLLSVSVAYLGLFLILISLRKVDKQQIFLNFFRK